MPSKRFWREMPTTEFDGDTSDWIAVLPIAAIEQHGPHLPVGVDALIAEGMVERCAAVLPPDSPVTFLPLQEICKSNEHLGFAGTLTLDWDTTIHSWLEIGESVARAGVRKFVLVTSHGGNVPPMEIVARELRVRHGMLVVTTSWGRLGKWQEIYDYGSIFTDIHGGNSETSVMLALRPDLVDMSRAEDFASTQSDMKAPSPPDWLSRIGCERCLDVGGPESRRGGGRRLGRERRQGRTRHRVHGCRLLRTDEGN